jgi:hypothetical protein
VRQRPVVISLLEIERPEALLEPSMKLATVLFLILFAAPSCSKSEDATGSVDSCATAYNLKVLDECVAACLKCQHGVTITFTTSCKLKGTV